MHEAAAKVEFEELSLPSVNLKVVSGVRTQSPMLQKSNFTILLRLTLPQMQLVSVVTAA